MPRTKKNPVVVTNHEVVINGTPVDLEQLVKEDDGEKLEAVMDLIDHTLPLQEEEEDNEDDVCIHCGFFILQGEDSRPYETGTRRIHSKDCWVEDFAFRNPELFPQKENGEPILTPGIDPLSKEISDLVLAAIG